MLGRTPAQPLYSNTNTSSNNNNNTYASRHIVKSRISSNSNSATPRAQTRPPWNNSTRKINRGGEEEAADVDGGVVTPTSPHQRRPRAAGNSGAYERQPQRWDTPPPPRRTTKQFAPRGNHVRSAYVDANDEWVNSHPSSRPSVPMASPRQTHLGSTGSIVESQAELVAQLQDVVVKLSKGALSEGQSVSQIQNQLGAYMALVSEQDRLIEDVCGMNARLQKEKDVLLDFRKQSLQHDYQRVNNKKLTSAELATWVQREYERCNGLPPHSGDAMAALSPRSRNLVYGLASQLQEERSRRLLVEEQSCTMLGEQQLTLHRLEARLAGGSSQTKPAGHFTAAVGEGHAAVPLSQGVLKWAVPPPAATEVSPARPYHSSSDTTTTSSSTVSVAAVRPRGAKAQHLNNKKELAASSRAVDHSLRTPTPGADSMTARSTPQRSRASSPGLVEGSPEFEKAEAILADIRTRYGLV